MTNLRGPSGAQLPSRPEGRNRVSVDDRRYAPEFAEAPGLLAAGLLVEGYGDSMSRFEVFGGFTLAITTIIDC